MSALNRALPIEDNPGDARLVAEYLRERFGDACALQEASTLSVGLKHLKATPYDGVEALQAGADDFLAKQNADSAALIRAMRHAVQRKTMVARQRESEARWRTIVEAAEDGIVQADRDGTIVAADARAVRLLCAPDPDRTAPQSLAGRSLFEFGRLPEPGAAAAATFFLRDNGIGFGATDAAELFTPFYRAPSARACAGNGIGLANAARAVERHGGSVWAESQPGSGACFYFTLRGPAMDPEPC